MTEQKESKYFFWGGLLLIFIAIALFVIGFNYYVGYQHETVESYLIYSYLPSMQKGETFQGIQMNGMGKLERVDADDETEACQKAEDYVNHYVEMYRKHLNDDDTDKRMFCIWHLRSDYTLLAVQHARNISPETIISLVGSSPRNLLMLLLSLEKAGLKFRILNDYFENEQSDSNKL